MRQGVGQRDQHHGLAADLEQLHDRRDGEHRHRAGHPGRHPVHRRPRGVQGADEDLLGGVRLQRQPDQPGQQVGHQRVPRRAASGSGRNEALDAKNFFDPPDAEKPELDQKQFGGVDQRARSSRTRRSSWSTTRARASTAGSARSSSCPIRTSWPAASPRRSSTPRPASRSRTTPSPRRASRASRRWRSGTTGTPPRTRTAPLGNYSGGADASPDPEPVHGPASTRTWAASAGPSPATRTRGTRTARPRNLLGHRGPDLHPERQELAGLPHLAHQATTS